MMKAAFGILALYVSIPLAIVAAQSIVAHEAGQQQSSAHAAVAQVIPTAVVVDRH
jgi:ABC-type phosphate/phosphonate transport system permease subunit